MGSDSTLYISGCPEDGQGLIYEFRNKSGKIFLDELCKKEYIKNIKETLKSLKEQHRDISTIMRLTRKRKRLMELENLLIEDYRSQLTSIEEKIVYFNKLLYNLTN